MSAKTESVPAFPLADSCTEYANTNRSEANGMGLRDYFAAHEPIDPTVSIGRQLAERLTGRPMPSARDGSAGDPVEVTLFWADAEAVYRYLRADAMLRARVSTKGAA